MATFGRKLGPLASLCVLAVSAVCPISAQITLDGHAVQIHGFASQGFAYSDNNNYLTMPTSNGSFTFTDAGLNVSTSITDKFRVGAQTYIRNVGNLGHGHVTLDWALGDYRFTNWFGVRAGKVKTVFGLYNDTQDAEFLHTWALLPQSIYPLDLRSNSLAHVGGDVYGRIPLASLGSLAYTGYAGRLSIDRAGGFAYGLQSTGLNPEKITGTAKGGDIRWTTPVPGLFVGASFLDSPKTAVGTNDYSPSSFRVDDFSDKRTVFYGQYTLGNWCVEGEYSRQYQKLGFVNVYGIYGPPIARLNLDRRSWYVATAYRISKRLELGAYNSRYFPDNGHSREADIELPPAARHILDQTVTARIDLARFWDFKIEGHFIRGYGDPSSFVGFYPQNNPSGFKPATNLLILRTGVNF